MLAGLRAGKEAPGDDSLNSQSCSPQSRNPVNPMSTLINHVRNFADVVYPAVHGEGQAGGKNKQA